MRNFAYAARPLFNDLAAGLLLALLVALRVDPTIAALCAIAFGVGHVVLWKALGKPVAPLQWASLGLVVVFGTAGLVLHDVRFVMAKPSLIYLILAVVMLKPGWMLRYMPPIAAGHGERLMIAFGYVWAGLMASTAAANLIVAVWFPEAWPLYKATFPLGSKLALFAIQYLTVRAYVIRKVTAQAQPA